LDNLDSLACSFVQEAKIAQELATEIFGRDRGKQRGGEDTCSLGLVHLFRAFDNTPYLLYSAADGRLATLRDTAGTLLEI
jgi:hypothetical protein